VLPERPENPTTPSNPSVDRNAGSGRRHLEKMVKIIKQLLYQFIIHQQEWYGVKKFPLCELAHTSFRGVRVIHRQREREAHAEKHTKNRGHSAVARGPVAAGTGGTPDRRSDDETVVACPEDWWLDCQAAACAKPIGPRPNRPNRSRSVTADDMASGSRRRPAPVSAGAVETLRAS
jgi:hypothetical protein